MGFEPTTASLEGWNSTTELRPPLSLQSRVLSAESCSTQNSALTTYPPHHRLKDACPLACPHSIHSRSSKRRDGGQARIRTLEDISQQIYSLPPLATWVPARDASLDRSHQLGHANSNSLNKDT
jgi:hypothetical protein